MRVFLNNQHRGMLTKWCKDRGVDTEDDVVQSIIHYYSFQSSDPIKNNLLISSVFCNDEIVSELASKYYGYMFKTLSLVNKTFSRVISYLRSSSSLPLMFSPEEDYAANADWYHLSSVSMTKKNCIRVEGQMRLNYDYRVQAYYSNESEVLGYMMANSNRSRRHQEGIIDLMNDIPVVHYDNRTCERLIRKCIEKDLLLVYQYMKKRWYNSVTLNSSIIIDVCYYNSVDMFDAVTQSLWADPVLLTPILVYETYCGSFNFGHDHSVMLRLLLKTSDAPSLLAVLPQQIHHLEHELHSLRPITDSYEPKYVMRILQYLSLVKREYPKEELESLWKVIKGDVKVEYFGNTHAAYYLGRKYREQRVM